MHPSDRAPVDEPPSHPSPVSVGAENVPPHVVTREIESGVMGDYDAKGRLVGIEVLSVSQRDANLPVKRAVWGCRELRGGRCDQSLHM